MKYEWLAFAAISWKDEIRNKEILKKAIIPFIADILAQMPLGWARPEDNGLRWITPAIAILPASWRQENQGRREMKPETEEHCIRYPEAARKRQKNLKEPYYRAWTLCEAVTVESADCIVLKDLAAAEVYVFLKRFKMELLFVGSLYEFQIQGRLWWILI